MPHLDEPLNAQERLLYGVNVRLNILIEQMSSLLNHIAEKENVAVEKSTVTEEVVKPVAKRQTRKKV